VYGFTSDDPPFRQRGAPVPATQLVVADEHSCVLLESGDIACVGSQKEAPRHGAAIRRSDSLRTPLVELQQYLWEEPPAWPDLLPVIW